MQAETLEGEKDGGEGAGHHGTFFISPRKGESVGAEFFEDARGVAGDPEGKNGLMEFQEFGGANDFRGFAGAGHQDYLFGGTATQSFAGGKEEFGGGDGRGLNLEVLGPDGGDQAG
jgi:hypothetical protein